MAQQYNDKESACFKLVIYYTNGGIRSYYSRDWKNGKYRPDIGFKSLEDLVARNASWVKCALIYDKRWNRDWLVRKCLNYNAGWIVHAPVKFQ